MTDPVAKKMSQASASTGGAATQERAAPKKGERYRCTNCGMEIQVTADCKCQTGEHVEFRCCGLEMAGV